ncbi:thymidylate kinase [Ruminococcus sp. Marseille-P6503]|uniref:dTMP kinase n=1 Tax=Ruminococcus sp. Marseille-P6503 TaxID=2364796 RepID=UPI000F524B2A|nr:thymidylate kinase [Ruminococcus sp. Marseille-P6503]
MQNNKRLIVLEGLDGSGKTTQFRLITEYFKSKGVKIKPISFPDYDQPSSALVKMYLNGEFGTDAQSVNAYAASSFYAVDRYASYKSFWEKDYNDGVCILAARYTTSNCIYQMVKLERNCWKEYIDWLCEYEYGRLELPEPDMVIFLDMNVEISQRLMTERYSGDEHKKDIHEADVGFLKKCREAALYSADRLGWKIVKCSDGDKPLTVNEITERILELLSTLSVKG